MPPPLCGYCHQVSSALRRPKTGSFSCVACFQSHFEEEVHQVITKEGLFTAGERVAVCASGGKDSTVLAHLLSLLNRRHNYELDLFLLSIDEGIRGYRDDSLAAVQKQQQRYGMPLHIVSYKQLYGWSMDEIVRVTGKSGNCTFCGVFRRQAIDRGAVKMKAVKVATGHNADDLAETVLMNLLRGDIARLDRSVSIVTGDIDTPLPRVKPFKYCYEKEIVLYAYYTGLEYFSTECIYSPFAYRGYARELIKDLERANSRAILDIIHSGEQLVVIEAVKKKRADAGKGQRGVCQRCGYMSSNSICKACIMLQQLEEKRTAASSATASIVIEHEKESQEPEQADTVGGLAASLNDVQWKEAIDVTSVHEREHASKIFASVLDKTKTKSRASTHVNARSAQW